MKRLGNPCWHGLENSLTDYCTDSSSLSEKVNDPEYTEDEPLPELPTDPISFDDENWQQELQEFENADDTLNEGDENENSLSNHSSVTLSSRGSKRTYDEYDSGEEGYGEAEQPWVLPDSPGIFFFPIPGLISSTYVIC